MSIAPPRRNGAVIAVVLAVDLALAAVGAVMLVKGLAKPQPAAADVHGATSAPPTPVAVAPAPPPPTGAAAVAAPAGTAVSQPPPAAAPVESKPDKASKAKHTEKKAGSKTSAPLDPYAGSASEPATDQSQEVERQAAQSFGSFRSCQQTALQSGPVHGDIKIAFQIEPDGHVDHAKAVVNTTHSDALAQCLEQTIATWTFAPHSGPAASYERPFSY